VILNVKLYFLILRCFVHETVFKLKKTYVNYIQGLNDMLDAHEFLLSDFNLTSKQIVSLASDSHILDLD